MADRDGERGHPAFRRYSGKDAEHHPAQSAALRRVGDLKGEVRLVGALRRASEARDGEAPAFVKSAPGHSVVAVHLGQCGKHRLAQPRDGVEEAQVAGVGGHPLEDLHDGLPLAVL